MRKYVLLALVMTASLAQSQGVYNYFPPPGITYSAGGGMALGGATGGGEGSGTLNAAQLYVNGVAVSTGTVTSVGLTTPSWLTVTGSPVTSAGTLAVAAAAAQTKDEFVATPCNANGAVALRTLCTQDFPASGVTAGTYAAASVTVDATGRITAANNNTFVTSVGFTEASNTPIFSITNSPVTSGGTLTETLKTQSANTVFAGPSIGSVTQPTFRPLVPADLPLPSNITWTGQHTFTPASGVGVTVNGRSTSDSVTLNNGASQFARVVGNNGTGTSNGLDIVAGTNGSDVPFQVTSRAATTYLQLFGDGGTVLGAPTGGDKGVGTLNAVTLYQNGGLLPTLSGGGNFTAAPTISGSAIITTTSGGNITTAPTVNGAHLAVATPSHGTNTVITYGSIETVGGTTCNVISGSQNSNISGSCSFVSIGKGTISFSSSYSAATPPSCTVAINSLTNPGYTVGYTATASALTILVSNSSQVAADGVIASFICMGG